MGRSSGAGAVEETYVAALQHDLVSFEGDTMFVGVVRHPTGWFHGEVDENRPTLGPPADLLEETKQRHEDLKMQGLCDEEAHNQAWDDVGFEERYREHVRDSAEAQAALDGLADRVRDGETVVLVCFEGEDKRCHRHMLVEMLEQRLDGES
ncbi:hypothetical protein BV210_16515 [Halorientalis sp. IM1011]|uniref:DUF488 domain-containing protein n=1 Tax=Halorientalis sp. IM1011 TaxID=1932360 RepID=UPI00097CCEAA|nr:DUF488 domain-containing protein [Halorientalis sp. IM1011]AQL44216.1 hypothetical protein BV210_16515 [Halorientalis sp. IM1011]